MKVSGPGEYHLHTNFTFHLDLGDVRQLTQPLPPPPALPGLVGLYAEQHASHKTSMALRLSWRRCCRSWRLAALAALGDGRLDCLESPGDRVVPYPRRLWPPDTEHPLRPTDPVRPVDVLRLLGGGP